MLENQKPSKKTWANHIIMQKTHNVSVTFVVIHEVFKKKRRKKTTWEGDSTADGVGTRDAEWKQRRLWELGMIFLVHNNVIGSRLLEYTFFSRTSNQPDTVSKRNPHVSFVRSVSPIAE